MPFKDGGKDHEPKLAGGVGNLEEERKQIFTRKNAAWAML